MRNKKSLTKKIEDHLKKFGLVYLLLFTFLILLEPLAYRNNFENDALIGTHSYYELRLSEEKSYGPYSNDQMLLYGRPYQHSVSNSIFSVLSSSMNPLMLAKMLPLILGLLSILLSISAGR